MNDRFKFRAKRCDNGEFVFGYLNFIYVDKPEKARIYCQDDTRSYDVITKTLGQCTGLKDANGKLIYEGDILFHAYFKRGMVVRFNKLHLYFGMNSVESPHMWASLFPGVDGVFRIIGNIHEKPQLLEAKK